MGSVCSKAECNAAIGLCNCFLHDKNIQYVDIDREITVKWIWTYKHDTKLKKSISDYCEIDSTKTRN